MTITPGTIVKLKQGPSSYYNLNYVTIIGKGFGTPMPGLIEPYNYYLIKEKKGSLMPVSWVVGDIKV